MIFKNYIFVFINLSIWPHYRRRYNVLQDSDTTYSRETGPQMY